MLTYLLHFFFHTSATFLNARCLGQHNKSHYSGKKRTLIIKARIIGSCCSNSDCECCLHLLMPDALMPFCYCQRSTKTFASCISQHALYHWERDAFLFANSGASAKLQHVTRPPRSIRGGLSGKWVWLSVVAAVWNTWLVIWRSKQHAYVWDITLECLAQMSLIL